MTPVTVDDRPAWAQDLAHLPFQFTPDSDRLLVVPDPEETKGAGNFEYSETTKGNISHTGTVIAVGPGEQTIYGVQIPMRYAPMDRVLYSKFAGDDLLLFEGGSVRPYLGSVLTDSILVKILRQGACLGKVL